MGASSLGSEEKTTSVHWQKSDSKIILTQHLHITLLCSSISRKTHTLTVAMHFNLPVFTGGRAFVLKSLLVPGSALRAFLLTKSLLGGAVSCWASLLPSTAAYEHGQLCILN